MLKMGWQGKGFFIFFILVLHLLLLLPVSTAALLNTYPAPFVEQGNLVDPFVIVVGDAAAASDVAGAIDIAMDIQKKTLIQKQQHSVEEQKRFIPAPQKQRGNSVTLGSTSDLLELNEPLGDVREALTENDLDLLRGGTIVAGRSTTYRQYLKFPTDKGKVIFGEDEKDRVDTFLNWDDSDTIFTWELEFEEGLESQLSGNTLTDLEDEDINILGTPFVIANAEFIENTGRLRLTLLGGAMSAHLGENEKEIYTINGKDYLIEVLVVSEQTQSVKFRINGEITPDLKRGETIVLKDGTQFGIHDITTTQKEEQKNLVQFYTGAQRIDFEDKNALDNNPSTAAVRVNGEVIEDSDLKISSTVLVAGKKIAVNRITYRLFADAILGDIFISPGTGLREHLQEPEGMLTPNWNIQHQGLASVRTSLITLNPSGDDSYRLEFVNQENIYYRIPLLSNEDTDGKLNYGDNDDDLWFIESNSDTTFYGTKGDYFVLSNCATNDNTCFTHVVRYSDAATSTGAGTITLGFEDLGTGRRDVTLSSDGTKYTGELVLGGVTYKIFADTVFNPDNSPNISVDLNGDGSSNSKKALIGIQGEGLLSLGTTNTNSPNTEGARAIIDGTTTLALTTLKQEFDEASTDEELSFVIAPRSNNKLGISSVTATSGKLFGLFRSKGSLEEGMTAFGTKLDFHNPSGDDRAEKLTLEYPASQRGAHVEIIAKQAQPALELTATITPPKPLPKPKQESPTARLASELQDITTVNAILVGGPCANKHTATLMNNPHPCHEAIPFGVGIIWSIDHPNGKHALILAGRTAEDTRRASLALVKGALSQVPSDKAAIKGKDAVEFRVRIE